MLLLTDWSTITHFFGQLQFVVANYKDDPGLEILTNKLKACALAWAQSILTNMHITAHIAHTYLNEHVSV